MLACGELVEARGESWIVTRYESFDACAVIALEGVGPIAGQQLKLIEPFDRLRVLRGRLRQGSRQRVLRIARSAIADVRPARGLWSAAGARITLLPYQLEPALAVLNGATRVLLADAVGLGKTIQAGLVLAELRKRGLVDRALVLTPAGLRHAWAAELQDRFGLTAVVLDQSAIAAQSWLTTAEVNPWTCHNLIVASIDFVKRPDVLGSVAAAPFDLLIADEAHHLTPGSERGAAVARLSLQAPWVILVSATPHSGDESAFTYLASIGAHDDRLTIFRRSRADAGLPQSRRTCLLAVTPTAPEAALFEAIDGYTNAIWRARGTTDPCVRLVAITLRRRAASSATAVLRSLLRRRSLLANEVQPEPSQPELPWDEVENGDSAASDHVLAMPGLDDVEKERRHLDELVVLAQAALTRPSKIERILRLISRVREPALIFTEYRDTLDALAAALTARHSLAVIHGAVPIELRRESIDRFTRAGANVLLATDAAGEGLNLQDRCRLVVNTELPWNPLRLEQRIGRVDRIGQTRRVHAVHLFHRQTVEDAVLAQLERRRLRAAAALNEMTGAWSSETDLATAVFDGHLSELPPSNRIASVRVPDAATEAKRLESHRICARGTVPDRPVWTPPRHAGRSCQLVRLSAVRHTGSTGLTIDEWVEATLFEFARTPSSRREWREIILSIARLPATTIDALGFDRARRQAVEEALTPFRRAVVQRLQAIRGSLAHSQRRQWQGSLFDRRVEQDEERRVAALDAIDARLARKVAIVDGLASEPKRIHRRLIAAWPLDGVHKLAPRERP